MIAPQKNVTVDDLELQRTDTPANYKRWKSCCFDLQKDFVEYIVKYVILLCSFS